MECKFTNEELIQQYQNGDEKALELITENNTGLIRHIATKYSINCNYIDYDDLMQQGWTGLLRAAQTYKADIPNSAKFSTWAVYWIQQAIQRYLIQKSPKSKEVSMFEEIGEEITIEDTLSDPKAEEDFWRYIEIRELRKELEAAMARLSLKEREIIKLRFGWDDNVQWDFESLSKIYGGTKESIVSIYKRALYKIRHTPWGLMRYKEYMLKEKLKYKDISMIVIQNERLEACYLKM